MLKKILKIFEKFDKLSLLRQILKMLASFENILKIKEYRHVRVILEKVFKEYWKIVTLVQLNLKILLENT